LSAGGEVEVGGSIRQVYHCRNCVIHTKVAGMTMELPLAFIVGPDGSPVQPTAPHDRLDLKLYGLNAG
jgi:hypothetical protein